MELTFSGENRKKKLYSKLCGNICTVEKKKQQV